MAKIIIKDGEISSSASINFKVGGNFASLNISSASLNLESAYLTLPELTTQPPLPPSGKVAIYASSGDSKLYYKNDLGNIYDLSLGSDIASSATTAVTAGSGLSGGGTVGSLTLNVGAGDGISVSTDSVAVNNTVVRTTGSQTIAGLKTFSNDIAVNNIAVNGGSISTTSTTFDFLNTNATTIYFGSSAQSFVFGDGSTNSPVLDLNGTGNPVFRIYNYTSSIVQGAVLGEFKLVADAGPSYGSATRSSIRTLYEGVSGAAEVRIMAGIENNPNLTSVAGFGANTGITFHKNATFLNSGTGVSFANTTPDGTGATDISELLDDYEEGTFSPVAAAPLQTIILDAGGSRGHYVKIGNIVTVFIELNIMSTTGTTQAVSITGLPFASYSGTNSHTTIGFARIQNSGTNMITVSVINASNSTTLNLKKKTVSSTTDSDVTVSDFNSSSVISVNFTYRSN